VELHNYAEDGRMISYALTRDTLLVATGPGSMTELLAGLDNPATTAPSETLFAVRGDAEQLRRLLGRIGLLGVGENNDLRAIWVLRQASAPLLRHLGALRAELRSTGRHLRLDASAELRGDVGGSRHGG